MIIGIEQRDDLLGVASLFRCIYLYGLHSARSMQQLHCHRDKTLLERENILR